MNQFEVPALLEDTLPGIRKEMPRGGQPGNINAALLGLARYTRRMIGRHDWPMVTRCMRLADHLYEKGNAGIKNAVENVFVFAFSGFRTSCDRQHWALVQARIPMTHYSLYIKQIYRSGI